MEHTAVCNECGASCDRESCRVAEKNGGGFLCDGCTTRLMISTTVERERAARRQKAGVPPN